MDIRKEGIRHGTLDGDTYTFEVRSPDLMMSVFVPLPSWAINELLSHKPKWIVANLVDENRYLVAPFKEYLKHGVKEVKPWGTRVGLHMNKFKLTGPKKEVANDNPRLF